MSERTLRLSLAAAALCLVAGCATKPKPGGYYQDDGPPEKVPADVAQVPDAVPRDEPFHRWANRPYTVFGQSYTPVVDKQPMKQRGRASWYGRKFHGQRTASGETYDMFAMTAAHRTLPIPSYVRVTHLANGRSVVVRVNDRGPFHGNRIIDLSYAAAAKLGMVKEGSAMVEVERVLPGAPEASAAAPSPAPPALAGAPGAAAEPAALWLQIGAFASIEGAESFRARVARELDWLYEPIAIASGEGLHRVRLGPYRNPEEASAIAEKVHRSLGIAPVMIPR